ncbi:hypothetical protein GCM10027562_00510 [Arthrobacter pigmenti]
MTGASPTHQGGTEQRMTDVRATGWALPDENQTDTWHYFVSTVSLCDDWVMYTGPCLEQVPRRQPVCERCVQLNGLEGSRP